MTRSLGNSRRATLGCAVFAIICAAVIPSSARAAEDPANSACERAAAMTDAPGVSISSTSVATYPAAGAGLGTVGKNRSLWFKGVFHDVAAMSQQPLSIYVYDYQKGEGCKTPIELCHADGTGPSAPARCQFDVDSQRYFVEVRNSGTVAADFYLVSAYHCYVKKPPEFRNCAIVTP